MKPSCARAGRGLGVLVSVLLLLHGGGETARGQVVPGTNVNMVSGTGWPDGDPFLQRQNEPSSAASTRNPLHLLAGANDYRTVDLPGPFDPLRGEKMNADAWLGLFKSFDGGQTWRSNLLPGYPQDTSPEGLASPLYGRQAATDPVIRAGTNGLFYYAGLAFDRGDNAPSTIFVARYLDLNNLESGDPIAYLGTHVVDSDAGTRFLDKTALAVDIPRTAATCTIDAPAGDGTTIPQVVPAGRAYVAYTAFTGGGNTLTSKIMFSRSLDCGVTWSTPRELSLGHRLNQNAQIAVSPVDGAVYVTWRRFRSGSQEDAVLVVKSTNGGATFSKAIRVAPIKQFDQGTTPTSFRTNAFQTMAIDASGRVYVAWSQRGHALLRPDPVDGDARIVVSTSTTGAIWTAPQPIERGGLGHQIMPVLTFHAGRLRLLYYDLREDVSQLFGPYVDELPILTAPDPKPPRHTIDVFVAEALPAQQPVFTATRLSDYAYGLLPGFTDFQRLQYNPPNLPLFRQGTAPFMGDYLDLAPAPIFVQNAAGQWEYNLAPSTAAIAHGFWTDNRDVRAPPDGNWQNYTPVVSPALGTQSLFDPTQTVPPCVPGQTGMRNQNIYTARITQGLFVGSPGNAKPLGDIQRGFVVIAQNSADVIRSYRLQIENQPPGGQASFLQFTTPGDPLTLLDVTIPPRSTVARTVFVTSTDPSARVTVTFTEIAAAGGAPVPGGLGAAVVLNADPSTPRLQNPRLQNPSIQNPDIEVAEVYNPEITTAFLAVPSIQNPRLQNPSIQNPRLQNESILTPRLQNDSVANPGIINPSIQNEGEVVAAIDNPSIQNPRLQNADLTNAAFSDSSWVISNTGNTTASYTINLVLNGELPAGFTSQLLLHRTFTTPAAQNCELAEQPHTVLAANIPDPEFVPLAEAGNPRLQNPRLQNPTLSLAPGETATVTLRIVDPNRYDGETFDAGALITPAVVAHAVNTEDAAAGLTQPPVAIPLTITTAELASSAPGTPYSFALQSQAGSGGTTWTVEEGQLPPGLFLDPATGVISGTPTTPGNYVFTIRSTDGAGNSDTQDLSIQIDPLNPGGFDRLWNGADSNWLNPRNWSPNGVPQPGDSVYISAAIPTSPVLTGDVTVEDLFVEDGATLDTNGFTLTVLGHASAGNTVTGNGRTVMAGRNVTASGTFSNLTIQGSVTLAGSLTVTGTLRLEEGALLGLNSQVATAATLATGVDAGSHPIISEGHLTAAGVDVNGLSLHEVAFTIGGGALTRFARVAFIGYSPAAVQLTVSHPGGAPVTLAQVAFFTIPATGAYIHANDTAADGQALVINLTGATPADGSAHTVTTGGAVVNWLFDPGADLAVSHLPQGPRAIVGTPILYEARVFNGGPDPAALVHLTVDVPADATLLAVTPGQGTCGIEGNQAGCDLGTLAAGAFVDIGMQVAPGSAGLLSTSVEVTTASVDPVVANNRHALAIDVLAGSTAVDLRLVKTGPTSPVVAGTPFTYQLTVTNAGPAAASSVVLTDSVPSVLAVHAATPSQGSCSVGASQVVCALGTLAPGASATLALDVSAAAAGPVTNFASVLSAEAELTPEDNLAAVATMILGAGAVCAAPTFSGPTAYTASAGASTLVFLADMNHDGAPDIVTGHHTASGSGAAILLNDGTGVFGPRLPATSTNATVLPSAVADFNGDTHLDVLLLEFIEQGNRLRLLLGDGTGALTPQPVLAVVSPTAFFAIAADLDGDGDQDVLTRGTAGDLVVLRNLGTGLFAAPVSLLAGGPIEDNPIVGDFNGDNRPDIVVAGPGTAFTVLLADDAGGYEAPVAFPTASAPRVRAVGDVNGDGHTDIAVIEGDSFQGTARLTLRFGDGAGAFGPEVDVLAGNTVRAVTSADVNGDGHADLISTDTQVNTVAVQLGNGSVGFAAPAHFSTPAFSNPAVADLNDDGRPDIVVGDGSGTLRVLLNGCGQPPIDLGLTLVESADPVAEGEGLIYTVTLTNHSDSPATNVALTSILSNAPNTVSLSNVSVEATSSGGGTLTSSGGLFTWTLATVAAQDVVTFEFRVTPHAARNLSFTSTVTSSGQDTNASNNTVFETTTVTATGADLVVTNTNDSGPGSLRQAILNSNADGGDIDRIVFSIPGSGPHTIAPLTALPTITQPVVIDGTTQPGFTGTPVIELNGNGLVANGLAMSAGSSTVRGLAINRFTSRGISITTNGNNLIEGNFVGTDPTGTIARPNLAGIFLGSQANVVGGTTAAARNVISGNAQHGVQLGATATGNAVLGNYLGVRADGNAALANGAYGVLIHGATNTIGGTSPGAGNVISGNGLSGIWIDAVAGAVPTGNRVEGNLIGTSANGLTTVGNATYGIGIGQAPANIIGSPAAGRNVISGNGLAGILVGGAASTGNLIQSNFIGTDASGMLGLGNNDGVVMNAPGNTVGGTTPAARNIISGNDGYGIHLRSNGQGNIIQGNYIGVRADGTTALSNTSIGIYAEGAGNFIGGTTAGAGNVVSGNQIAGIALEAVGNRVEGNLIGTSANGLTAIGNGGHGVMIIGAGSSNVVGSPGGGRNVISGNAQSGVAILGAAATGNFVQSNYIGTDANGENAIPNLGLQSGIFVLDAPVNFIGGQNAGNVVSGNANHGITIVNAGSTGNLIRGNLVGLTANGLSALGNGGIGIDIVSAGATTIGGNSSLDRNFITGNGGPGIQVRTGATGIEITNNSIGLGTGAQVIGNDGAGIFIQDASDVAIGVSAGNVIAGNATGVSILGNGSVRNQIINNEIFGNSFMAIDLGGDGPTANDPGDGDAGPNNLQNFPVLGVSELPDRVLMTLNSVPNQAYTVFYYLAAEGCNSSTRGSGLNLLAGQTFSTDANGNASLPFDVSVGPITAIAVDAAGNTSEFSPCVTPITGPAGVARVFVVHQGVGGAPGTVSIIDPSTNTVTNELTVGLNAQDAALSPDGTRLYVTNFISNNVSVIDVATNQVIGTVTGMTFPIGIRLNPDSTRAYVAGRGGSGGSVFVVDTATLAVIATIPVGGDPFGLDITPDGSHVYVANQGTDDVSVISTATNTVTATVAVGDAPRPIAVAPDASRAYVGNLNSNNVSVIDTTTNTVIATVAAGAQPNGIGITPDGSQVYVSNLSTNTISRIDVATNTVVGSIAFAGLPYQMDMLGSTRAYVGALSGSAVRVIDTTTNTILTSIPTPSGLPAGIAAGTAQVASGSADLALVFTDAPDPATFNSLVTFTASITNNGPDAASQVTVTTQLPTGYVFVSATGATCSASDTTVTCPIGTLASGATAPVELSVRVNTVGTLTTTARVHAAQGDPQIGNNLAPVSTTVTSQATTFAVTNMNDSGAGSLRDAITLANANTGVVDTVSFDIPGGGPYSIALTSALPTITDPAIIDGTTQTGFAGTPIVELNGTSAGANTSGLQITAGGSTVRGLVISRFSRAGVALSGGGSNVIQGNYIGVSSSGTTAASNGPFGIDVFSSQSNLIGGVASGAGNVIAAATSINISLQGGAHNNTIVGNLIGLNAAGTAPLGPQENGVYLIGSNGNQIGGTASGARNVIAGHNGSGQLVIVSGSTGNVVQGNYIGTNAAGSVGFTARTWGIQVNNAVSTTVGGSQPGAGNVISGNAGGIVFYGTSTNNTVAGNLIGTAADGATALPNGSHGVSLQASTASNNLIGGLTVAARNIIAFNTGPGVAVSAGVNNRVLGNHIYSNGGLGIDLGVVGVTPNDAGDGDTGANNLQNFPVLTSAVTAGGTTALAGTLNSSANTAFRIEFFVSAACDSSGRGEGEIFGGFVDVTTDVSGNATFNTTVPGSGIFTATATDPSGNTSEFSPCVAAFAGPTTFTVTNSNDSGAGSFRQAILDANARPGLDTIAFNIPGTVPLTIAPTSQLPTITDPVIIDGFTQPNSDQTPVVELTGTNAPSGTRGLWVFSGGTTIRGLTINDFTDGYGIYLDTGGNNVVAGNRIGTDWTGSTARPNAVGIRTISSGVNILGGFTASARNVISGNTSLGIELGGGSNTIVGNYIGLNASGTAAIGGQGNLGNGIRIAGNSNEIGSATAAGRNVISGFTNGAGIVVNLNASDNLIHGNYIGTTADGSSNVGSSYGILIAGTSNQIGSGQPGGANLIGGNTTGIRLSNTAGPGNTVLNNVIGLSASGATLGNSIGIETTGPNTLIGGTAEFTRNFISGNGTGLRVWFGADFTRVEGNTFGFSPAGEVRPNALAVDLNSVNSVTIGGLAAGAGNIIAHSTGAGVQMLFGLNNAVRRNSIHSNGGLGIDLTPLVGVTPNDPLDADTGANNFQNFPTLSSVVVESGTTTVTGSLHSTPNSTFVVDFFTNTSCHPSGHGEGQTWWGSANYLTDANGDAPILLVVPGALAPGTRLTATALDVTGGARNSSEFSNCIGVPEPDP